MYVLSCRMMVSELGPQLQMNKKVLLALELEKYHWRAAILAVNLGIHM